MNGTYNSGFNQSDWYALRDALLAIMNHKGDGECESYEMLSAELKSSPIGSYLYKALDKGDQNAFDKAVDLLVPGQENRWLVIWKS